MSSKTIITALAATALSVAVAGPAAAETVLVEQARPFSVDAAKGVSVFSRYDESIGAYRLVARQGGQLKVLNVDPLPVPFDVDIGTSRTGALVAVYSRSIDDENTDLFRYSFASDSETRLASLSSAYASEHDPSVWRGDIAFLRDTDDGRRRLMIGNTTANGAPRTLVTRRSPQGMVSPALSSLRVAYVTANLNQDGVGYQAVHTRTLRAGKDRTIHVARSGGLNAARVTGPSWSDTGRALYFARTNSTSGTGNRYLRYSPATGQLTQARGNRHAISTAFIGGQEGLLVTTNPIGRPNGGMCSDDGAPTTCQLIATGPLTYSRP